MGTKRWSSVGVVMVTSLSIAGLGSTTAFAAEPKDLTCSGEHTSATVRNVTVPQNATCRLTDMTVLGSISISKGGNGLELTRTKVAGDLRTVDWQTTTSATRITAQSSQITGDVVTDNARATYTDSTLGSLTTGGFFGGETTLTLTTVHRNVVTGGRWEAFTMNHATVDGNLSGGWAGTKVLSSSVKGKTSLGGLGISVCGSSLRSAEFGGGLTVGDGKECAGNTFDGDLNITSGTVSTFYDNVVTGTTTSPAQQSTPVKGARNDFRGAVSGVLASLR